jgi:6-pyruvoyltetrahydropterin/6-carboxytetrahydropterin synthase
MHMAEIYEVRVRGRFSAVHQLRLADGSLEPLHGHDWKVDVIFRGARLDSVGLLIDFEEASAALRKVLAEFDHGDLNTVAWLAGDNPSAERVARVIFERMQAYLGADRPLAGVCVEEAPGCLAGYWVHSPNA